jgi:intein/homing endonuclease
MRSRFDGLTKETLDQLTDSLSDKEISEMFGLSRTAATHLRKKLGIKSFNEKTGTRKYLDHYPQNKTRKRAFSFVKEGANENYFHVIDSPRKAYWLGLLYADGWIVTEHSKPKGFSIALHERDKYLLEWFASDLNHKGLVKKERATGKLFQVKLTSEVAANDLIGLGVVPKKSKIVVLPKLNDKLYPYFVRGYFDGDGCVYTRKNSISIKITSGSNTMLLQLNELLKKCVFIEGSITEDKGCFNLCFYAGQALRLASYIYNTEQEKDLCMVRKREKVLTFKLKV